MLKQVFPYGPLNDIDADDEIIVRKNTPLGFMEIAVPLTDFNLAVSGVASKTAQQTKICEGTFDLTELGDISLAVLAPSDSEFIFVKAVQLYITEEVTTSEGATIAGLALSFDDSEVAFAPIALDAGTTLDLFATKTLIPSTEGIYLRAIDGGGEVPDGTIEGGEIKVRVLLETLVPISSTYNQI